MIPPSHRTGLRRGTALRAAAAAALVGVLAVGLFVAARDPGDSRGPVAADPAGGVSPERTDPEQARDDRRAERREREEVRQQARTQQVVAEKSAVRTAQVAEKTVVAQQVARQEKRQEKRQQARQARIARRASQPFDVKVGSFNVLGSQHTGPGGERNYPAASIRSVGAADLMARHGVDVVGTQELQADQLRAIQGRTGMAAYPGFAWGEAETDNSILWDDDRFELVGTDRFTITFMGRPRPQPIVRLRVRETGREFYVVNTHPSAGGGRYAAERARGRSTLVGIVNGLKADGSTVFVTGDMNDREAFFCQGAGPAGLTSPSGGSAGGGCSPPPGPIPVDWVVGTPDIVWSDYWRDTSPTENRISDHFFISASARVE